MATILIDSEYSDELMHMNEDQCFNYGSPFSLNGIYSNGIDINTTKDTCSLESCRVSDCSSEDDFDLKMLQPHAPPPSPQESSMLDMLFASKLNSSLEACLASQNETADSQINTNPTEHALEKSFSRSTHQPSSRGISKKHHRRSSSSSWQHKSKNHHLLHMAKVNDQADKLRKALQKHLMDEETLVMINELNDMGLQS